MGSSELPLIPRTINEWLAVVLAINAILFFIFAFLFSGGAYPWGEIRGALYFVVTGTSEVQISRLWFWITYWQGLFVWSGGACYLMYLVLFEGVPEFRVSGWWDRVTKLAIFIAILVWLILAILGALAIAT